MNFLPHGSDDSDECQTPSEQTIENEIVTLYFEGKKTFHFQYLG